MNRKILKLSVPNILTNLTVPLLGTVDTALMGRMDSEAYLGAVAVGSLIFSFIYWGFGFLRMGTVGLIAQLYGQKDEEGMADVVARAMAVAILGAVFLLVFQVGIEYLAFSALSGSEEVESLGKVYFKIRMWAAPASLAIYVLIGFFLGVQNAYYPLLMTLLINVVNIVLNFYFVQSLDMTVDGVAWATVIAQYTGLILGIILFLKSYRYLISKLNWSRIFRWEEMKAFWTLNRDIFIRTFCLIFALAFFTDRSANQGDMVLAVNAVLLQFVNWLSYAVDGFAYAAESLTGKYKGAKNYIKLNKAIKYSFIWGLGLSVLFSVFYAIFGVGLLGVFTDKLLVIEAAKPYMIWIIIIPVFGSVCYIWDGIFIGLTASVAMRNSMLISCILYLLFYLVFIHVFEWGNHGLWGAFLLFLIARGWIQSYWYLKNPMFKLNNK